MRFPSCCTQRTHGVRSKNEIRNSRKMQAILSLRPLRFSCACIAYVTVFFCSASHDQRVASIALCTAAWRPTYKSVFIGVHAVSKLPYATQQSHSLRRSQKTEICNACTRKAQRTQSNRLYSLHALRFSTPFVCMHCMCCVAYDSLETNL